ncbi:MAG: tetratricopeptide repeat protein [Planctomycetaceae bacterium]
MTRFQKLELGFRQSAPHCCAAAAANCGGSPRWDQEADRARRSGRYENALRYYSRSLECDRSLVSGWLGQVQMLVLLGECPEAVIWSRKAVELFPGSGDLIASGAQALCREKQHRIAQEMSDASLAAEGETAFRWMVRGELQLATNQRTAHHCFQTAQSLDSDWLVALETALVYREYGSASRAIPYLQNALERAPEEAFVWYSLGLCHADLQMTDAAARSFERSLQIDRDDERVKRSIASLATARRRWFPFFQG